jgi:hypothetical protein
MFEPCRNHTAVHGIADNAVDLLLTDYLPDPDGRPEKVKHHTFRAPERPPEREKTVFPFKADLPATFKGIGTPVVMEEIKRFPVGEEADIMPLKFQVMAEMDAPGRMAKSLTAHDKQDPHGCCLHSPKKQRQSLGRETGLREAVGIVSRLSWMTRSFS